MRRGRPPACGGCGECKRCSRAAYMRGWYARNPEKRREAVAKRDKQGEREKDRARWRGERRARANAQKRGRRATAAAREAQARWRRENRVAQRAHRAVAYAIETGRLVRGACEVCGTNENVHAHHDDYSKRLDVRWLCAAHHREEHARYLVERAA